MSALANLPAHAPHADALSRQLHARVDLATFDIVVNLEGQRPTFRARIRIPQERRPDIERFIECFRIADADWTRHPAPGWVEVQFPVLI